MFFTFSLNGLGKEGEKRKKAHSKERGRGNILRGTNFFIKLSSLISQLSTSKQQTESTRRQTLRRKTRSDWLTRASVRPGPTSSPPDQARLSRRVEEEECGWSARGSRPRWSDRWNSEKKTEKAGVLPHKTMFPKGKGTPVPSDGQAREK